MRGGSALCEFSWRNFAVEDELRSFASIPLLTGALNWKNSYSAVGLSDQQRPARQSRDILYTRISVEGSHVSPPAIAPRPWFSNLSTAVLSRPLGQALIGPRWFGSRKLTRKKGTSSSHGILLKLLKSGTAIISWYPFSALLICNSLKYVWSCISQPKMTEQKPKPSFAMPRNFFLDMSLPRKTPSMSMPATLTLLSFLKTCSSDLCVTSVPPPLSPIWMLGPGDLVQELDRRQLAFLHRKKAMNLRAPMETQN